MEVLYLRTLSLPWRFYQAAGDQSSYGKRTPSATFFFRESGLNFILSDFTFTDVLGVKRIKGYFPRKTIIPASHRAMFKPGTRKVFQLCHLVKKMSAAFSADSCKFWEAVKAVPDQNWIGGDISSDRKHTAEHLGHLRFPIPVPNWHFLIKVCTYIIAFYLACWEEFYVECQVWMLQYGNSDRPRRCSHCTFPYDVDF